MKKFGILLLLLNSLTSFASELYSEQKGMTSQIMPFSNERLDLKVRTVQVQNVGQLKGTVLYLPGFADQIDYHMPLVRSLASKGLRVISFDYPSHGYTKGSSLNNVWFSDLSHIALAVVNHYRKGEEPLYIIGFSTGGLLAVRTIQEQSNQSSSFAKFFDHNLSGIALIAPGVAVHTLVGEAGIVTARTLTRNPIFKKYGKIKPKSPLLFPVFSSGLLLNSYASQKKGLPKGLPTLIYIGGDRTDRYADSKKVTRWAKKLKKNGKSVQSFKCDLGYHALDLEPEGISTQVIGGISSFLQGIDLGDPKVKTSGPCKSI